MSAVPPARTRSCNVASHGAVTFYALIGGAVADVIAGLVEIAAGQSSPSLQVTRLAWAALLVAVAIITRGPHSVRRSIVLAVCAGVSALLFARILLLLGDVSGISFAVFMMSPVLIAALLQEEIAAVVVSSISTLVVGIVMFELLPGSSGSRVEWAIASATAGALALHSSIQRRRAWASNVALEAQRLRNVVEHARAERAALMGQVAGGLAHEINNPLTVMTANLRFLQDAQPTDDKGGAAADVDEAFAESLAAAERIAGVVRRIKSLAAPDVSASGSEPKSCEACATTRSELAQLMLMLPANVQIVDDMPAALPEVALSRVDLSRIVGQLLPGSMCALTAANEASPRISLAARETPSGVELSVADNCRTARAASPDETVAFGPRGLDSGVGLVLLRELLRRRGGDVRVECVADGGERVVLHLPLDPDGSSRAG